MHQAKPGRLREQRALFVEHALATFPVLAFDLPTARVHARIGSDLRRAGQSIGSHDLIIVATALANGFAVATLDARAFPHVPDLSVAVLQLPDRA